MTDILDLLRIRSTSNVLDTKTRSIEARAVDEIERLRVQLRDADEALEECTAQIIRQRHELTRSREAS